MSSKLKDLVEREILIRAPMERVFAALTDPAEFPTWGPEAIEGKLVPGERPVLDFGPAGGGKVAIYVVALEPPKYFAYRWVQGVTDPEVMLQDPLARPNTLVEFKLEPKADATRVRVIESGLSALPGLEAIGIDVVLDNMGKGWDLMLGGLGRHFVEDRGGSADAIENELLLPAKPAQVFAALQDPARWWAESVSGELAPGQQPILDFGMFGRFRIDVQATTADGYLAYRAHQGIDDAEGRLAVPRPGASTLVEFKLEPHGEGTRVRLRDSGFGSLEAANAGLLRKRAEQGWGIVLGMLAQHFTPR